MKHSLHTAALAGAVLLALSSTAVAGGRPDLVLAGLKAGRAHQAGELIVKFKDGTTAAQQAAVRQGLGAQKLDTVRQGGNGRAETALLRMPSVVSMASAIAALQNDPSVDYAEPNWTYTHQGQVSNDLYYTNGTLWGMYGDATTPANQYGSQAGEAWAARTAGGACNGVFIGVIDEGIYFNHEDLSANIWVNPYDAADGIDNDGNGYVDDIRGWDFDGNSNNINSGGANDDHGTHVAGTIGGMGGNSTGVAGMCWSGLKMISGKFLGGRGGTTANAIKAVDYFTDLKKRHGMNIPATSNSWGGGGYSQGLYDAIERANAQNILFIAAAGNDAYDNDVTPSYPSGYSNSNIIAVASTTKDGALSSFSQWGATTVDLGAPGSAIMSTVPKSSKGKVISGYASYSGTSMATPHVTGAVAMYSSNNPGASAATVKAAILNATTPTTSLQGKVLTGGRLNASGF